MEAVAASAASSLDHRLGTWLTETTGDPGPFRSEPLLGGYSNETSLVTSPSGRWVLRRPPAARLDQSAHSVEREYRVLMALADTHVPVPRPYIVDQEPTPGGPPALLMEYLDGVSLTNSLPDSYRPGATRTVGFAAMDVLADLHSLDWRDLGLADFGRPEGFLARQVERWTTHYARYRHRDLPDFDLVAAWLEANRPPDGEPGIVHGDFHVDNCLFSRTSPPHLQAVIDWEMSTIGDPLLDVGLVLAFWGRDRSDPCALSHVQAFSRSGDAPTREELATRYEQRSGRSLEHLPYYMALAFFKLAAVVEAAHLHFTTGLVRTEYTRGLGLDVPRLLAEARRFAGI